MGAYIVTEDTEGTGGVIFAKSDIEARRRGADAFHEGELSGLHVTRAKHLDRYEGKGVPASVMIDAGWNFECSYCGASLNSDEIYDRGASPDDVVGVESGHVFCDANCASSYVEDNRKKRATGNKFLSRMRARVRSRFGNVEFVPGRWHQHVYVVDAGAKLRTEQARVSFNFPGQVHGPASLHYDGGEYALHCCNGDRTAFIAFCEQRR